MKRLVFAQTAPLVQDDDGSIRVSGSRVTLDTIVGAFTKGATAEQIQDSFPSLTLRQIYGAIAYYLDHQAEVDKYLAERRGEAEAIRRQVEDQPGHREFREELRQRRTRLTRA